MKQRTGLAFVELLLAVALLVLGLGAFLGATHAQTGLNAYSANRVRAINDANRVLEQLRQNHGFGVCTTLSTNAPTNFASWNAWLEAAGGGGGKSIQPNADEHVAIHMPGGAAISKIFMVSICWREGNRTIGECLWNGAALSENPGAGGNPSMVESPAMLSTVITCRV